MSTSDVTHLQKQIEEKKKQLRQLVRAYGYTGPLIFSCSQELDQLVYRFMRDYSPQKVTCKKRFQFINRIGISLYICPLYFTITGVYVD
ncbi:aspartyl-phosphate phosphatase Spo0E family protein [Bacillus sp. L_1B0_8]|uniref:aspartyl-phosphate phosphatase Spo0E family protein n=1 Tax=Bacillus sp. L_1B0_8 TaxID=1588630 RepID=UPI0009E5F928|nr:aspartyl-phosphate phosphatase Spo0E family protein [Bacillus sp. L_1B0_8]